MRIFYVITQHPSPQGMIGILSNDDDDDNNDGSENFSSKVNSRCFKIHYSYSMSVNLSNIVEIFRAWILKMTVSKFKTEIDNGCLFTSSRKRKIWQFHVVVEQKRQRKVQKSFMHVQSCCFALQVFGTIHSSPLWEVANSIIIILV